MNETKYAKRNTLMLAVALGLFVSKQCSAQGSAAPTPPLTAKAAAPFDISGYWVSVITQNWRLRMVTPPRGDYMGIPLTPASKAIADAWDPAKDEAAGNECKYYGAGTIMTLPERLHITWQNDNTLRMDVDAGTQTRIFHFGDWKPPDGPLTWQGNSVAQWSTRLLNVQPVLRSRGNAGPPPAKPAYLSVKTDHMKGGYLRKNGVPYSDNAVLTEYYDPIREMDGETWMIITTVLDDPQYLENPLILTAQFRKQADVKGWEPTPCSARW